MLHLTLISSIALVIYFLAVWRGGAPERVGGGLLLAVFVADEIHRALTGRITFGQFETFLFTMDLVQLIVFTWLALRANRFWPIFAAALKLVAVFGHLATMVMPTGDKMAYWIMVESPTLPVVLALAMGLFAHWRRQHRIGPYPDWRTDLLLR